MGDHMALVTRRIETATGMKKLHHPDLGRTVEVPERIAYLFEEKGWIDPPEVEDQGPGDPAIQEIIETDPSPKPAKKGPAKKPSAKE